MDGELNFKAIFDYASAEKGVDQLVDAFENGSVRINEAFNLGKVAEGNKREIKQMIDTANEALKELETMYRNTMREIEKSGGIKYATNEQKEYIAGLKEGMVGLRSTIKGLRENMQDTQDVFSSLASGLQGLMGAYTAVSGIMAQFGADSEDLQKVQTKLQASMSILMGIQQVYNTFLGNSAFRLGVLSKATELYEAVTKKAAISAGLMKVALGGVATAALVAIALLARWASKRQEEIKKEKELAKATNDTAASQLVAYRKLQTQWQKANGELEKQRKIVASDDWKKLGLSVKSVNDAERILINNTEDVVKALVARARAQASYAKLQEDVQTQLEIEDEERKFQSEKQGQKNRKEIDASLNRQKASDIRRQVEESQIWRNSDARYRQDEKNLGLTDENGDRFYVDKKGKRVYRPKTGDNSYEVAIWEGQARGAMGNTKTQPLLDYASYLDKQAEYFDAAAEGFQNQINKSQKKIDEGNKAIMERFNIAQDDENAWKKILEDAGIKTNDDANYNDSMAQASYNSSKMAKELAIKRKRELKDIEFEVREARVSAMKDSSARELSQLSLDHDKEMEALKRQQEDRLKQLQDEDRELKMAANPNLKDYQVGSSIKSLPKEEADRFQEQQTLLNEAFERAKADLLGKYGTLEDRRRRLSDKWQKDIEATTDADVRAILEKEARADIANFEYENVSEFGTTEQVYAALKAKLEAEADLIADDAQRAIALASAEVQLAELKYKDAGNYRNYEKELEATNAIYDAKIREARARKDNAGAEVLEKEKMSALMDLRKEYTAMYDLIFSSADTMTNNNLAKAIEYTEQAIKDSKGDAKELAELYERLRGFQTEQSARSTGWGFGGIGAGFRSIMNAREWQSLADSQYVSEEERKRYQQEANAEAQSGFSGISKGIGEISEAFDGMGEALDKFGGSVAEFGKALKEMGKQAKGVGDFFSNLDADFKVKDKGQVINQAIQGTLELISMVGSQIAENKEIQEEWNRTVEESAHKLTMLEIDKLSYKQSNIFGVEDPFKKATDSANVYFKSMEEVAKLTDKLAGGQVQTGTTKALSGENIMKGIGAGAAVGAAIGTAVGGWFAGLGTIIGTAIGAVVGGITGVIGGLKEVPVFESLEEHYEYLFDPKTYELNPELLADYDKLDESTKQIVDHWDEIREKALKAQEDLKANLSEFVGDIGNKLRDTLIDAWSNRQLYASIDKFKDYVNDAIAGILEQKVFSAVFGDLFDRIGQSMEASFIGDHPDGDITDELDLLFQKLPDYLDAYDRAMTQAQGQMEANGYDGFLKRKQNADATTGSFQQISETTGSVIAGGVTAIRLLLEQKKAADVTQSLQLGGIASSVEDIRGLSLISMGYLENIANYTSVLPYMRETLDNIERRTRAL